MLKTNSRNLESSQREELLKSLKADFGSILDVLGKDGFIIYIKGRKEKGKTDFSLLLAEIGFLAGLHNRISTNIHTESYMIESQITDLETLEQWLKQKGRKLFILDEAGMHLSRMRFMSAKSVKLFDIIQLIRHYDAGFIAIAPSHVFVDKRLFDTDILDVIVSKRGKTEALIIDRLFGKIYTISDIPRTSIAFDSKDIAKFTMRKEVPLDQLPLCCRVAQLRAQKKSYKEIQSLLHLNHDEQVRRLIMEHLEHSIHTTHIELRGSEHPELETQNL